MMRDPRAVTAHGPAFLPRPITLLIYCVTAVLGIVFLVQSSLAESIPRYDISRTPDISDFNTGFFVDKTGSKSIHEISASIEEFALSSSRVTIRSGSEIYWFAFTLENLSPVKRECIVRFDEVYMEQANIYYRTDGGWHEETSGLSTAIRDRKIKNRNPCFLVSLEGGEAKTIYLRLHSRFLLAIGIHVNSISTFAEKEQLQIAGYWFFFGAALAILFYNTLLLFYLKEIVYLFYILYGYNFVLFVSLYSGYMLYINDNPGLHYDLHFSIALTGGFLSLFTRSLLKTKTIAPVIDRCLLGIFASYLGLAILIVADVSFYHWLVLWGMPSMLFLFFTGIYCLKRSPLAVYYMIAISGYALGFFQIATVNLGLIPYNIITRHSYLMGSLIDLIIFSMALGYRIKLLQDEKLQFKDRLFKAEHVAKQTLEEEVNRKTANLQAVNKKLQLLSNVDGLTGLYNRRFFDEALVREWGRLQRSQQPISLLMCDIDHFKIYNDLYGHPAGDECLKAVAQAIADACGRRSDVTARYGGEEFVAILPEVDLQGALKVTDNIRKSIRGLNIRHRGGVQGQKLVTLSFGVVSVTPKLNSTPSRLIKKADRALYESKNSGRNRVTIAPGIN